MGKPSHIKTMILGISGFSPIEPNKMRLMIEQFKKKLNQKVTDIELLIEYPGNMIFPGRKSNKCYLYSKPQPSLVEVVEEIEKFVDRLKNLCSTKQNVSVCFLPCMGRRKFRCTRKCDKCISYPYFGKQLQRIESALIQKNIGAVITYREAQQEIHKKLYGNKVNDIKKSKFPGTATTALLRCQSCRSKPGHQSDHIHLCCDNTRATWSHCIVQFTQHLGQP